MMKIPNRLFPLILVVALALMGCAGGHGEVEKLPTLSAAEWPTPASSKVQAQATPFPKATVLPVAQAENTAPQTIPVVTEPDTTTAVESTSRQNNQPTVKGSGLVSVPMTALRAIPNGLSEEISQLPRNEAFGILAQSTDNAWVYVVTLSLENGWLPLTDLRIIGNLADVPILPINEATVANILDETTGTNGPATNEVATTEEAATNIPATAVAEVAPQITAVGDLLPMAQAQVTSLAVNVRQGPGANYGLIDSLDNGAQLAILAINRTGEWVLVEASNPGIGWVSVDYITVDGALADVPQVISARPSNDLPVGQIAPVFDTVTREPLTVKPNSPFSKPAAVAPQSTEPTQGDDNTQSQGSAAPIAPNQTGTDPMVVQQSSGGIIMVINPEGTNIRHLTSGLDPALSPDGQTVAFTRWEGDSGTLWLIDSDGSNECPLLGEIKKAKGPTWSPDGSQIVVNLQHGGRVEAKETCSEIGDKNPGIGLNVDPDSIHVEFKDNGPHLCWTLPPDPHWGLRVIKVADGSFEDIYGGQYAFRPAWDPTQPWRIVVDSGNGLLETDVTRENYQNITNVIGDGSPDFSPDGRFLAVSVNQNNSHDIHRLNADGSGRVRLTQTPLWVTATPGDQEPWNNVSPAWSPDGSQIAFLTDRNDRWEIWVMNADGSDQRPLFSEAVNAQLNLTYDYVDERMISW